jgi:hypothetical protein
MTQLEYELQHYEFDVLKDANFQRMFVNYVKN